MTEHTARAHTVSELVDAAFSLYRRHALQYIIVSAIATTPVLVLQLVTGTGPDVFTVAVGLVQLASWISISLVTAVVAKLGSQAYLGEEPDVASAVREIAPRVPAILVASFLRLVLITLGLVLLLVGALYAASRWFAVTLVIALEGKGPIEAFGRSTELSRGRKRHILNTLGLTFLVYIVLSVAVIAVSALFGSETMTLLLGGVFNIVAYPVVALTQLLLYYEARVRAEGFDLEQMAAALDAPVAETR
jgi:hypothetical protein